MRAGSTLFPLMLLAAGNCAAQYDGRYLDDGGSIAVEENVSYGYAQVLRADEVVGIVRTRTPEERCDLPERRDSGAANRGTALGAIVGAAIGNQVGDGDGRRAATVAGAVVGGAVGRQVAESRAEPAPGCHIVEVEREEQQVIGYDVEYMYKGEKYMSRLPFDPGNRLRIRVSVTPDLRHGNPR